MEPRMTRVAHHLLLIIKPSIFKILSLRRISNIRGCSSPMGQVCGRTGPEGVQSGRMWICRREAGLRVCQPTAVVPCQQAASTSRLLRVWRDARKRVVIVRIGRASAAR
jgi:hypothetical protein